MRRQRHGRLAILAVIATLTLASAADAHRSGCHRWHSCPSDRGTYECGDLGHCSGCPDNQYCLLGEPRTESKKGATPEQTTPNPTKPRPPSRDGQEVR